MSAPINNNEQKDEDPDKLITRTFCIPKSMLPEWKKLANGSKTIVKMIKAANSLPNPNDILGKLDQIERGIF